jgi:hypothetical protein
MERLQRKTIRKKLKNVRNRRRSMTAEPTTLENFEKELKKKDFETIVNRALRLQRLSPFKISSMSTLRIMDYCEEAEVSFINGCFRSCIICSAIAVEQALKHTLIFLSEDWEETYWEIEIKKLSFVDVIKKAQNAKIVTLNELLEDANWLRNARNEVVAHPLYVGNYFELNELGQLELKETEQLIWANKVMFRDVKKLLRFLDSKKRKEMEEMKITEEDSQGKILEEMRLKDFLKEPKFKVGNFILWFGLQNQLVEEIAFQAYRKMVAIINNLLSKLNAEE